MPKKQQKQNFLQGALILSMATALVKVIGAVFKIPLANYILGPEGYAFFLIAYTVYSALLVIATAGLPVAISKMVSEAETRGRYNESRRIFKVALVAFIIIGAVITLFMIIFSRQLADLMNSPKAYLAIMAIAPAVFFVSILATYRGYNQGMGNMYPTAYSQVIEALGKLIIGIVLAYWVMQKTGDLIYAAAGAIAGVTVGTALSTVYIMLMTRSHKPTAEDRIQPSSRGTILAKLLKIAIPITVSSSVLTITSLIDASQINGRLKTAAGFSEVAADKLFSAYGFAQNLFTLPPAFITTISISVVPAIAAAMARGDKNLAGTTISTSFKMAVLLAFPAAAGMMSLSGPITNMLYSNQLETAAITGPLLSFLCWSIPFVCLSTITTAILQSLGRVYTPIITMVAGGIVKVAINYFLVGDPKINISGAPVGTLACYSIISVLNIAVIISIAHPPKLISSAIKPAIASVIMGFAAWGVQVALAPIMGNTLSTGIAVICGVILYVVFILIFRVLNYNDIMLLPKGEKIARLIKIRKI